MADSKEVQDLKNNIKALEYEIDWYNDSIDRAKANLAAKGIPQSEIAEFIDAAEFVYNPLTPDDDKPADLDTINTLIKVYPEFEELVDPLQNKMVKVADLNDAEASLKVAKKKQNSTSTEVKEETKKEEKKKDPEQDGHVYPVKLVTTWTNKLKQYNKQMDDFIKEIDELDPITIDATWICKKIEAFCRRINYYLALLRSKIVKTLHYAYKQANVFSDLIDPIVNFNPTDIMQCLGWVKAVIKFFFGPYEKIITFIQDFMTYTPPLVNEATSLLSKTASIPGKLLSKINIVAENKKGEKKQLVEVYKEYIDIHMDPITMGDIMGGDKKEPEYKEPETKTKQESIYDKEISASAKELAESWDSLRDYVEHPGAHTIVYVAWPVYLNTLGNHNFYTDKKGLVTGDAIMQCYTKQEAATKIFGYKVSSKKDCSDKKINTNKYKFYQMISSEELNRYLGIDGYIFGCVYGYYKGYWSGDEEVLNGLKEVVDFLKSYATSLPQINSYLDKIGQLCKKYAEMETKKKELNKPSVFN